MRAKRNRGGRRQGSVFGIGALLFALLAPSRGVAGAGVVVLNFGGPQGATARNIVSGLVSKRWDVISGERLLAACDELGVPFGKGPNLARAAKHVGAGAVIGGKADSRQLSVAVFSGRTGRALVTRSFRWGRRPPKLSVRQLRALLFKLLQRELRAQREPNKPKQMTFAPDPVTKSSEPVRKPPPKQPSDTELKFDPSGIGGSTGKPATGSGGPAASESSDSPPGLSYSLDDSQGASPSDPAAVVKRTPTADEPAPRVTGQLGFGIWSRSFAFNQAAASQTHSEYSSGAAIALGLALRAEPFAFFTKGFLEDIFLRVRFQTSLGLSSRTDPTSDQGFGTSMWELIVDGGYGWQILPSSSSPVIDIGLGGGLFDFSVDWEGKPEQLAATSYGFLLFGLGGRIPFMRALDAAPGSVWRDLGAELRFDYRIVFGAGPISEDRWYGTSSQGGLCLSLGLTWRYKKVVVGLSYTYTRYFLDFDDATFAQRLADNKLAAGGALDQLHGAMLSVGYSY